MILWLLLTLWIGGALGALAAWLADEQGYRSWLDEPPVLICGALMWPWAAIYAIRNTVRTLRRLPAKGGD
jgi:hypothetical protein